jgi:hypothetical protein
MMSASSIVVIVRVGAGISVVVPCKKHFSSSCVWASVSTSSVWADSERV